MRTVPDPNTLNYSESTNPTAKEDLFLILKLQEKFPSFTSEEVTQSFFTYMKHWNVKET